MHLLPRRYVAEYVQHGVNGNRLIRRKTFWRFSREAAYRAAKEQRPAGMTLARLRRHQNVNRLTHVKVGVTCLIVAFGWTAFYDVKHDAPLRVVQMDRAPHHMPEDSAPTWNCHVDGNKHCEARLRSGLS